MIRIPRSLSGRLLVSATILIVIALLVTGIVMNFALRRFIQGQIDGRLDGQILSVAEAIRRDGDGRYRLEHLVDGPPFERRLSGWYWVVLTPQPVLRSQSLDGQDFTVSELPPAGPARPVTVDGIGPPDEPLHVRVKQVPIGGRSVTIAAAAHVKALSGPLREALVPLAITLGLLALGLIGAVVLQVRLGLRPLQRLRNELVDVTEGRADRISSPQPSEVVPLVGQLNTLLEQHAANLERARRHVANLAHGLKTPLATLALGLDEIQSDRSVQLASLVTIMDRRIRHHLTRARTAALGGPERSRVPLALRIQDHALVFGRLYAGKHIVFDTKVAPDLIVACETHDLDEILGNLLDNACKWTDRRIDIVAVKLGGDIHLTIDDDGPGIPAEQLTSVMRPGQRADESTPGYGFGLPIARELIELYGGTLGMAKSTLGGVRVTFFLPSRVNDEPLPRQVAGKSRSPVRRTTAPPIKSSSASR